MFTSDDRRRRLMKTVYIYMLISLFCVIFGEVYEKFSHGVYSHKMIYAFSVPLIFGAILFMGMVLRAEKLPGAYSMVIWNAGVASLTTGLMFDGVLEIYGTTNRLIWVYYIAGGILLIAGLISYICFDRKRQASAAGEVDETADS